MNIKVKQKNVSLVIFDSLIVISWQSTTTHYNIIAKTHRINLKESQVHRIFTTICECSNIYSAQIDHEQ